MLDLKITIISPVTQNLNVKAIFRRGGGGHE
jgi:hypothetical protein